MMLNDIEKEPLKHSLALPVKQLLSRLGFMDVCVLQDVGKLNVKLFIDIFKLRLNDIFMQD